MKRECLLERARENVTGYQERLTKLKESLTNEFQSRDNLSGDFVEAIESASRKSDTRLELKCIGYVCEDPSDVRVRALFEAIKKEFAEFDIQSRDWTDVEDANLTISWEIR